MTEEGQQPKRQKKTERQEEPVKYGDIFINVHGELVYKPIVTRDAATMQAAENAVLGQVQKGSVADVMQSVATMNEITGAVSHDDAAATDISREHGGVTITVELVEPTDEIQVITESIGDQVLGQYTQQPAVELVEPTDEIAPGGISEVAQSAVDQNERAVCDETKIKLGEILEDASCKLERGDKAATREDAEGVIAAETVAAAAKLNNTK